MWTKRQLACLITVILVITLLSCGADRQKLRTETFALQDSLYSISLQVPVEMDSFYTWVDHDDTDCGDLKKYRFSNSQFQVIKEDGFIKKETPDSSYSLTFLHINRYNCKDLMYEEDLDTLVMKYEEAAERGNTTVFQVFKKESKDVNGTKFKTLEYRTDLFKYTEKYPSTYITSFVYLDSIELTIIYECSSKNCDSFITDMEKSLETIKIKKI